MKLILKIFLFVALLLQNLKVNAYENAKNETGYYGGEGTIESPYLIGTPEELNYLRIKTNENSELNTKGKYFALNNDIDMSNFDTDTNSDNGNWEPIGTEENPFLGNFNGKGYSISNISINSSDSSNLGVFGHIHEAEIKFLNIENVVLNGDDKIGGLVGYMAYSRIEKIYVSGDISGKYRVGGVVGSQLDGLVELAISNCIVRNSGGRTGGIVGSAWEATMKNCLSKSTVEGFDRFVGGISGYINTNSSIVNSLNTGIVKGTAEKGGVVGYTWLSDVINSYWDIESSLIDSDMGDSIGLITENLIGNNSKAYLIDFDFDNIWTITDSYPNLKWKYYIEEEIAKARVEDVENEPTIYNLSRARIMVNQMEEGELKEQLQQRLNNISTLNDLQLERKIATSNVDIYIKSENMLSMTLSTNSITFEDYSGVDELKQSNAIKIDINSSLPYQLNAYLIDEIYNSDKSKKIDIDRLNIKDSSDTDYKQFTNINNKLILKDNCNAGNNMPHNIDLKLLGGNAYPADIYKTVIKFEAEQK